MIFAWIATTGGKAKAREGLDDRAETYRGKKRKEEKKKWIK